jgi:Na+/H+ antiporter NhaD/arsenite permease-like protein
MSYKEWTAVVQLCGAVLVAIWLVWDLLGGGAQAELAAVAMKLVWAIVAVVALNVVGMIVVAILVAIFKREELRDEKADERDQAISAKSSRNGYVITSSLAALALLAVAFGVDPVLAIYALFVAPLAGGVIAALSELVYYRVE